MPISSNLCILIAEIVGGDRLIARLGETETARAEERCLNRADLAVGGSGGEIIARDRSAIIATFEQCDSGVMAACEAQERVRKLPPVSGTQMRLKIAVHFGEVRDGAGKGIEDARLLLQACDADQSLASAPAVSLLSPPVRNFASTEAFHNDIFGRLPWAVFTIGTQGSSASSMLSPSSPRPEPSSPLISSPQPAAAAPLAPPQPAVAPAPAVTPPPQPFAAPAPAAMQPVALDPQPAASPPISPSPIVQPPRAAAQSSFYLPRLRLKHQGMLLFVEENRPIVLIGRELGNDIVIIDPRASRQHARIERRRGEYVLVDQSTNGCFVALEGKEEQCIKGSEVPLTGTGCFGCGFSSKEFEDDLVFFEFV